MSDNKVVRWESSMFIDPLGSYVTYHDYMMLKEDNDRLRAELIAYQKDVEGAERRVLAFAHACVRGVEGITVGGALEAQRDEIAKLRAELANLQARDIHTCWAECQRPMCVMRRERDRAVAELAEAKAHRVPDGYALVPVEPTAAMIAAGWFNGDLVVAIGHALAYADSVRDYKSMLSAAKEGKS